MMGYQLTPQATADIDSIAGYIALQSTVERAIKVLADIRAAIRKLAEMRGMGHHRTDVLDRRYRFWSVIRTSSCIDQTCHPSKSSPSSMALEIWMHSCGSA
jgi:plasmid stabilization system protein ParE